MYDLGMVVDTFILLYAMFQTHILLLFAQVINKHFKSNYKPEFIQLE
jgi:hypothetical protein